MLVVRDNQKGKQKMKVKMTFDTDNLISPVIVLENYLEGALADFENGLVENANFIKEVIEGWEILSHPLVVAYSDYKERFNKVVKERGIKLEEE